MIEVFLVLIGVVLGARLILAAIEAIPKIRTKRAKAGAKLIRKMDGAMIVRFADGTSLVQITPIGSWYDGDSGAYVDFGNPRRSAAEELAIERRRADKEQHHRGLMFYLDGKPFKSVRIEVEGERITIAEHDERE